MSAKVPLRSSHVENVLVERGAGSRVPKLDKVSGMKEDKTMKLEKEVHALRARIERRDETINKLQAQAKSSATRSDLEHQVEEIVKRHEASKAKYQSDLSKVKVENETLKRTNDEIKAKESQNLAKVSDIRSKLALAEAENARLKKELASRPLPQAGPSVDERLSWRKEKATLEAELRMMKKDAEERAKRDQALHVEQQSSQVIRAENERLKYGWTVVAEQYAELYEVSTGREKDWLERSRSMQGEKRRLESNVAYLQAVVSAHQAEIGDLRSQLEDSRIESEALVDTVDDLRTALLLQSGDVRIPQLESMVEVLGSSIDASDVQQIIELLSGHVDLVLSDYSDTPSHIASLTETILKLEIDLRQSKTSLSALEASQGRTELELETLKVDHATCGATISQFRFELDQAEQIIESRGQEVSEVRIALGKAETRAEKHAELLARANEQAARSKFAEEALEEEVTHLQNKYLEAAGFEEQYNELLERQAILEAREAMAIDEAERLSMQNAELLGHTNGSQKIGYVDGVRREMALCKHELATTRHLLNVSHDRIASLESEIAAYTSVSPESAIASSSRTRVVRRQPEGSMLTTSTSASSAGRISVSGPGGAKRFV